MNVSILIPAHNEALNIRTVIQSLLDQKTERAQVREIVVVASGCTDDTADIARTMAAGKMGIHVQVQERRAGKVAAINEYLKVKDPRADVIIVCSADLRVDADVVERICACFSDNPQIGMAGVRVEPDNDPDQWMGRVVRVLWELHHRVALNAPKMGELIAFRANLIERVSELSVVDEASVEDIVRSKGFELAYISETSVTNHGPESLSEYFEQRRRIARGHYWLDFAFGYEVATLDSGLVTRITKDLFREQDGKGKLALLTAVGVEVAARAAGFFDARIRGGKHRTWKSLRSTKRLRGGAK